MVVSYFKEGDILSERYRILERIGDGGMAIVYKALDSALGRVVAVKVLRPQYAGDKEFVERFRREAQSAASLSHPNIVSIFDVGMFDGVYYIVMEYVKGDNLKNIIRADAPLPFERAVNITKQICEALQHAHENNVIHRDIKPHNILVTKDDRVKVTDFGIARAASTTSLTETGVVIGSVHYFSPEQARGGHVEARSDLYSVGIILYEMVTGRVPFSGDTPIATALMHIQQSVPEPRLCNASLDPILNGIICKALEKNPEKRYRSAKEFKDELTKYESMLSSHADDEDTIELVAVSEWNVNNEATQELGDEDTQELDLAQTLDELDEVENFDKSDKSILEDNDFIEENDSMARKRRKRKTSNFFKNVLLAMITLCVLGLLAVWVVQMVPRMLYVPEVEVPDVVGKTIAEAGRILEEKRLRLEVLQSINSDTVAAGRIISQDPEARQIRKENREVYVVVSLGPAMSVVPNVVGEDYRSAEIILSDEGLAIGETSYAYSGSVPQGRIIDQEPKAGRTVKSDTPVNIVLSRGPVPEEVTVPNFLGRKLDEITQELEQLGLDIGMVYEDYDPTTESGRIISQKPEPGAIALRGTQVEFVISMGHQSSTRETRIKIGEVSIVVPPGPSQQEVVIMVIDDYGERVVYKGLHGPNDHVKRRVEGYGDARIRVYLDGILYDREQRL